MITTLLLVLVGLAVWIGRSAQGILRHLDAAERRRVRAAQAEEAAREREADAAAWSVPSQLDPWRPLPRRATWTREPLEADEQHAVQHAP